MELPHLGGAKESLILHTMRRVDHSYPHGGSICRQSYRHVALQHIDHAHIGLGRLWQRGGGLPNRNWNKTNTI